MIKVFYLKGVKKPFRDQQGKAVLNPGQDAVLVVEPEMGKAAIMSTDQFRNASNAAEMKQDFARSASRGIRFAEPAKMSVGSVTMLPSAMVDDVLGSAVRVISGRFQEMKGRVGMAKYSHLKVAHLDHLWDMGDMTADNQKSFDFLENLREAPSGQLKTAAFGTKAQRHMVMDGAKRGLGKALGAAKKGAGIGAAIGTVGNVARQHHENQKDPKNKKSLWEAGAKGAVGGAAAGAAVGGATKVVGEAAKGNKLYSGAKAYSQSTGNHKYDPDYLFNKGTSKGAGGVKPPPAGVKPPPAVGGATKATTQAGWKSRIPGTQDYKTRKAGF